MSMPFDAALKNMVRRHVPDYRDEFRLPDVNTVLDVDLSTVSAATDIVLADANPPIKSLATLDFQAGPDQFIDDRVLMYQAILRNRYHFPVHSVVLLLKADAYRPTMTGGVLYETAEGRGKMDFRFETVRLWEIPAKKLLAAGIGAASLAVLGKLPQRRSLETEISDVLRELDRRLRTEVSAPEANDMRTTVGVLMGLRIPREVGQALLDKVITMEESTTYQLIIEKGEARGEAKGEARGLIQGAQCSPPRGRETCARPAFEENVGFFEQNR